MMPNYDFVDPAGDSVDAGDYNRARNSESGGQQLCSILHTWYTYGFLLKATR